MEKQDPIIVEMNFMMHRMGFRLKAVPADNGGMTLIGKESEWHRLKELLAVTAPRQLQALEEAMRATGRVIQPQPEAPQGGGNGV